MLRSFWPYRVGLSTPHDKAIPAALANDPMAQKDKAVIYMSNFSVVHVQPEFQTVLVHATTFFSDGYRLCFTPLDEEHEVIGIPAVRNGGFPSPVIPDRCTSSFLDTVIPVPPVLSGFPAQIAFKQILIELIEHNIRQ